MCWGGNSSPYLTVLVQSQLVPPAEIYFNSRTPLPLNNPPHTHTHTYTLEIIESDAGSQMKRVQICIASKLRDAQPIQLGNRAGRIQFDINGIRDDSVVMGATDIVVPEGKLAGAREALLKALPPQVAAMLGSEINLYEEVPDSEDGQPLICCI